MHNFLKWTQRLKDIHTEKKNNKNNYETYKREKITTEKYERKKIHTRFTFNRGKGLHATNRIFYTKCSANDNGSFRTNLCCICGLWWYRLKKRNKQQQGIR